MSQPSGDPVNPFPRPQPVNAAKTVTLVPTPEPIPEDATVAILNPISPRLRAFLDMIAFAEGTSTHPLTKNDGYDVIVTGVDGPSVFTSYADHPFSVGGSVTVRRVPLLISTASGRYQLLARYWHDYREQLGLTDYSPASQDAVALQQIKERGAIPLIEAEDIEGAIKACSNIWASMPGNAYGQGGKSMDELLAKYQGLAVTA